MGEKLVKSIAEDLEETTKERTLVICKPESVVLGDYPENLGRIQRLRYKTPLLKMFQFSEKSVKDFYQPVIEKWGGREDIVEGFLKLTKNPSLAVVVEGPNSIKAMRKLAGGFPTQLEPIKAPLGSIRGDYSAADIEISDLTNMYIPNFMHASESKEEYEREIDVLIKHKHISDEDFFNYRRIEWGILYGLDPSLI